MMNRTIEEQSMIDAAYAKLNKSRYVLAPASEAKVIWRDFDPCRAVQPIANVEWPAVCAMRLVTLTHVVLDGDKEK